MDYRRRLRIGALYWVDVAQGLRHGPLSYDGDGNSPFPSGRLIGKVSSVSQDGQQCSLQFLTRAMVHQVMYLGPVCYLTNIPAPRLRYTSHLPTEDEWKVIHQHHRHLWMDAGVVAEPEYSSSSEDEPLQGFIPPFLIWTSSMEPRSVCSHIDLPPQATGTLALGSSPVVPGGGLF